MNSFGNTYRNKPAIVVLLLVAILVAVAGGMWLLSNFFFVRHAQSAMGQVVELSRPSDYASRQVPVVSFTDRSGQTRTQLVSFGVPSRAFLVGECVSVLYDPAVRGKCTIQSSLNLWLGPCVVLLSGLSVLAVVFSRMRGSSFPLVESNRLVEHTRAFPGKFVFPKWVFLLGIAAACLLSETLHPGFFAGVVVVLLLVQGTYASWLVKCPTCGLRMRGSWHDPHDQGGKCFSFTCRGCGVLWLTTVRPNRD